MTAKELSEHIKNAVNAFGLSYHDQNLINFKVQIDHMNGKSSLTFEYQTLQYRVQIQ